MFVCAMNISKKIGSQSTISNNVASPNLGFVSGPYRPQIQAFPQLRNCFLFPLESVLYVFFKITIRKLRKSNHCGNP